MKHRLCFSFHLHDHYVPAVIIDYFLNLQLLFWFKELWLSFYCFKKSYDWVHRIQPRIWYLHSRRTGRTSKQVILGMLKHWQCGTFPRQVNWLKSSYSSLGLLAKLCSLLTTMFPVLTNNYQGNARTASDHVDVSSNINMKATFQKWCEGDHPWNQRSM